LKAKEVQKIYNITKPTLGAWVKTGKIKVKILPSGRYDYIIDGFNERKTVIYARVSTTGQEENLDRQVERLQMFASSKGLVVDNVYKEIVSALNYDRKNYRKLITLIMEGEIGNVIIEYKDRILRIGFEEFKYLCDSRKVNIIIADNSEEVDVNKRKEITDDLISIIHHFSSKITSLKRSKKRLENIIKEDC
jgi:predicted site-specific integrase-resolvase